MSAPDPITVDEAAHLLAPLKAIAGDEPIAIAVSGGADSMALLWLCTQVFPPDRLHVLTVDHGLREGSPLEAAKVGNWCKARHIVHTTITWGDGPPTGNLQEEARKARYSLLVGECNALGIEHLLVAHHGDDQAETVFARLARGSGLAGLCAMAPKRLIAAGAGKPVTLWRSLLSVAGARVKATAIAHELPVSDDPSNLDPRFERVRRRAFLAASSVQGFLDSAALQRTAMRLQRDQALAEEAMEADFANAGGVFEESGAIFFDLAQLNRLSALARGRLLDRAAYAVSAVDHVPELDLPDPLPAKNGVIATQGGAILWAHQGNLWLAREPAAVIGRKDGSAKRLSMPFTGADTVLWDRRVIMRVDDVSADGVVVASLGHDAAPAGHLARITATLPALWQGGELVAAPAYAKKIPEMDAKPWNRNGFCLHINMLTRERFSRKVMRF